MYEIKTKYFTNFYAKIIVFSFKFNMLHYIIIPNAAFDIDTPLICSSDDLSDSILIKTYF